MSVKANPNPNPKATCSSPLKFVEQLRPFAANEESHERMAEDLRDVVHASEWLLKALAEPADGRTLGAPELRQLLDDLDSQFVAPVFFHLMSLREDLAVTLDRLSAQTRNHRLSEGLGAGAGAGAGRNWPERFGPCGNSAAA
ncbi:hypothetical protein [Roseateles koreensis]|uniref:Uncharacterized protein n=1 Tax=Roseateles koreensis TaxID=2987526 RepID=A0ABT5KN75_9BURK|nr:hypothetical protein [Roseateles koreensis]MDC8784365.1 hypothetical protein [Roseateles koreensis]